MAVIARSGQRAGAVVVRAFPWRFLVVPLAMSALALGSAAAAELAYSSRALPGLTVAGVAVGSLEAPALRERLESEIAAPWAAAGVTLRDGDREWTTTNGALGIVPDVDAAVAAALAYGKSGSALDRAGAWIDALRGDANVSFAMRARGDALVAFVASVARDANQAPVSGELALAGGDLRITPPQLGREIDGGVTVARLLSATTLGDREVALSVRAVYPPLDASGFDDAYATAAAALTPLVVRVEDRGWSESASALASLVVIDRIVARPGELPALPAEAIAPAVRYRYVVSLSGARLDSWVSALGAVLDHPAKNAKFRVRDEDVLAVVPSESGVRVDQAKLRALLGVELLRPAGGATREVAAPAGVDAPALTTEKALALVPQLSRTSTFTTQYPPSDVRHANISTGSSQFDGVVIMPGETFSFWDLLGPVTPDRGYRYAGAIINGRSDENVIGGGLCQVSTTIFNAISRQGYEIVERHAHGYYIDRYPLGLDAAVFMPGNDFRWRNDTASPVFLWSLNGDTSLTIDLWGIPTGRTVTFSDAVQWNFVLPAKDQPADPAFLPGGSVAGRDVWRTRTVTENGKVLHQDSFASHYLPVWGGPVAAPATAANH